MPCPPLVGHRRIADSLWRMVASDRLPQTLLFAGQLGIGKSTTARHLAAGINCETGPGRPCASCGACERILSADPSRGSLRRLLADRRKLAASKRSESPLVIASHPDVLTFPPDGPMRVIGIEQARLLRDAARLTPLEGRQRVFILEHADRSTIEAANALLKTLEEPAETLTVILTSENPYQLPDTVRSRAIPFHFSPLSASEMNRFLDARDDIAESDRARVSAWSGGSPGVALTIDVDEFVSRRNTMLTLVKAMLARGGFARFSGKVEAIARKHSESIERLAAMLASILRDLLRLHANPDSREGLTHRDIATELEALAPRADFAWTERALTALDDLDILQRLNIPKQIFLEAYALSQRK